jgi:CRISPR-associated protein Cst1
VNTITLYPGNWLYNAGVVGFLRVIAKFENLDLVQSWLRDDGTVAIEQDTFQRLFSSGGSSSGAVDSGSIPKALEYFVEYSCDPEELNKWLNSRDTKGVQPRAKYQDFKQKMGDFGYKFIYVGNRLFASKQPFQNLVQLDEWRGFKFCRVLESIPQNLQTTSRASSGRTCGICGSSLIQYPNREPKLEERLAKFQHTHFTILGPSEGEFPNSFWNGNSSLWVCPLCVYFMLHRDFAFINLADGSRIFLNAPSFQVMWYLNKLVREIYARENIASVREILGMSLIELALRLGVQLGVWKKMNIEVVSIKGEEVSFCSLPYEVVQLLLDKEIASSLVRIGEISVLRMVLEKRFGEILEMGERLMMIAAKPEKSWGKSERKYINSQIGLERNRKNEVKLMDFAASLFSLHALIEERMGGGWW